MTDRYGEEYVGYTYCEITEGIEKASFGSQGTNDYVFSIFAQDGTLFNVDKYNQIYKNASMTGVNISFITDKYGLNTAQTRLPDITGGIVVNNISTFADDVYNHIFEEPLVEVETFSAILATGYQQVELKGVLNAYNGYDTDEDTLTDWKEVDVEHWLEVGLITYNDDNTIKLPTVEQCMKFTELSYVESALDRLQSDYGANFGVAIGSKPVMPISSDPTNDDTDGDSYVDEQDLAPLKPFVNPVMLIHGRIDNTYDAFGLSTPVCPIDKNGYANPQNNHFNTSTTENGKSYTNIDTHIIDGNVIDKNKLSYSLIMRGYIANKNLFAFKYPNQDFAIKNAPKLAEYIDNVKLSVENNEGVLLANTSDIYATKQDLKEHKARFILIGHSNGGLVSRYYIENMGGDANVDKLITIDTPHYGASVLALSHISTGVISSGLDTDIVNYLNDNLMVPLDVELRPESSLFTGVVLPIQFISKTPLFNMWGKLRFIDMFAFNPIYAFYKTYEKEALLYYVQNNQSERLKGNRADNPVRTQYYAVGGLSVKEFEQYDMSDVQLEVEFEPDYVCTLSFDLSMKNAQKEKYPDCDYLVGLEHDDNVVEASSQFGVKTDIDIISDYIEFDRMTYIAVNGADYSTTNHFHGAILRDDSLFDLVSDYISD